MGAAKGAFVVLVLAVAGCRPVSIVSQPSLPTLTGEGTRCRNAVGQDQPLVTEWPAAEKANLETQIRLGSGVVSRGSRLEHERGGDLPRDRVADGGDEDCVIRAGTTQGDAETAPRTEQLEEAFAHELEHRLLLIVAEAFHVLIVED